MHWLSLFYLVIQYVKIENGGRKTISAIGLKPKNLQYKFVYASKSYNSVVEFLNDKNGKLLRPATYPAGEEFCFQDFLGVGWLVVVVDAVVVR